MQDGARVHVADGDRDLRQQLQDLRLRQRLAAGDVKIGVEFRPFR